MKKSIFTLIAAAAIAVAADAQAPRKVLVEDHTGIWCGYCPFGRTATEHLDATFGSSVICVGIHDDAGNAANDYLANTYSNGISNRLNNYGYPGGNIDRATDPAYGRMIEGVGFYDGHDWDASVQNRLNIPAPCSIGITSNYNSTTRALSVTVIANFVANTTGHMRFNCVLVEDSIVTNNQQHNYMNADASSPWYNKGNPIASYIQRDVARINLSTTIWGDQGSLPTSVVNGSFYSKSYNYTLPAGWNSSHVKIVGFVTQWGPLPNSVDTNQIYVMNANVAHLGVTAGIKENTDKGFTVGNSFPNPFNTMTTIPVTVNETSRITVKIYNVLGVEVATLVDAELAPGDHQFFWNGNSTTGAPVTNGLYVYRVSTDRGSVSKTMLMNR